MEDINKNSKACSSIHSNDSDNTVLKKIKILFGKQEEEEQKVEQEVKQKVEQKVEQEVEQKNEQEQEEEYDTSSSVLSSKINTEDSENTVKKKLAIMKLDNELREEKKNLDLALERSYIDN